MVHASTATDDNFQSDLYATGEQLVTDESGHIKVYENPDGDTLHSQVSSKTPTQQFSLVLAAYKSKLFQTDE